MAALCGSLSVAAQEPLLRDSLIYFEEDGHSFTKKHFIYDECQRLTSEKWFQRDDADVWDMFDELDTVYSASGKPLEIAHLYCNHGELHSGYKTEYTYDAFDDLVSSYHYDLLEDERYLRQHHEFTYNKKHQLVLDLCWAFDDPLIDEIDEMALSEKTEYSYGENGLIAEILYSCHLGEAWCPARHEVYTYDESDRLVEFKEYHYNWGQWYNHTRIEYSYEDCGNGKILKTEIYSDGDNNPEGWIRVAKVVETHYDLIPDFGSVTSWWQDGEWVSNPNSWSCYIEFVEEGYKLITDYYGISTHEDVKELTGRILSSSEVTPDLGFVSSIAYTYDESGFLAEELSLYSSNGGHTWKGDKYTYTFDTDRLTRTCLHTLLENDAWDAGFVDFIEYFSYHGTTSLPVVQSELLSPSRKRLMNGKPVIIHQGRIYNMRGQWELFDQHVEAN